jgi:hypothetical protein
MRKLKLKLEELEVESFATALGADARGTAHAHADTAIGGDTAYAVDPADTVVDAASETQPDLCFTCELSCGTRGC